MDTFNTCFKVEKCEEENKLIDEILMLTWFNKRDLEDVDMYKKEKQMRWFWFVSLWLLLSFSEKFDSDKLVDCFYLWCANEECLELLNKFKEHIIQRNTPSIKLMDNISNNVSELIH